MQTVDESDRELVEGYNEAASTAKSRAIGKTKAWQHRSGEEAEALRHASAQTSQFFTIKGRPMTTPQEAYKQFMGAAAAALGPDEYWCVVNDEGVFEPHASKDMGEAVRSFCDAFDLDWDEATDAGCRIAVVKLNSF